MAGHKNKALYSICVACLGFVCFAVGATAVGLPLWGHFDNPEAGASAEKGYFGLWLTCKQLLYGRERCGPAVSRFKPSLVVWIAGLVAAAGVSVLGLFCILSIFQLAMVMSREKVVMPYGAVVMTKLAFGLLALLLAIAAASLFALQADDRQNSFKITRGLAFYLQLVLIALDFALFVLSLYDVLFSRRPGGNPTETYQEEPGRGDSFNNPGFREHGGAPGKRHRDRDREAVSVTDASGRPYSPAGANGSVASVATNTTTLSSNGSTAGSVTRSPLRSSLKKPRPRQQDGLGIQNPGFSGHSPTLSRNGSTKKVRIQTHSTAV